MKLTKTMLAKVLKEVFEPKFNDLQKYLVEYAHQWLLGNHPVFVELPVVIPSEARAKLSALGIPADASVL